jgi:molybdopterin-binding protein
LEAAHLALKNISHNYKDFALNIPEFAVQPGQKLVILGENGAGKSTLVRILGLLEKPHRGDVFYRGEKIETGRQAESIRKRIATLFQKPVLLAGRVSRNFEILATLKRLSWKEVKDIIYLFGIENLLDRFDRELSYGQMRQVQVALTFLGDPEIIILDEPTSFLDEKKRKSLLELIMRAVKPSQTLIFITHRLDEVLRLGESVAVLKQGKLVAQGEPEAVFGCLKESLNSLYGEISVLKGTVIEVDGGLATVEVAGVPVEGVLEDKLKVGDKAALILRNDAVVLSTNKDGSSARNTFMGEVKAFERIEGMEGLYRIFFNRPFCFQAIITHDSLEKLGIAAGRSIYASIKASSIKIYKTV